MTPDIEGLPFEMRVSLYALAEISICSQNGWIDHPSFQKRIQECPFGFSEGQHRE